MAGWTNRGKKLMFDTYFRNAAAPTNFYVALVTAAAAPGPDTNTLSDLTEIAAGNGYTAGGYSLSRNSTDFDSLTENDTDDRAELLIKDVVWTASGGPIPASGGGARYAVLLTDEGTVGNRQVVKYWDLSSDHTVSAGQTLTLADLQARGKE
jgi:hypothetical protein